MARRASASDDVNHDETNPNQEEIVMTDDMKRQPRNSGPESGKDDTPAKDPFHNVILFPGRRKEGSNQEPPPPSAA